MKLWKLNLSTVFVNLLKQDILNYNLDFTSVLFNLIRCFALIWNSKSEMLLIEYIYPFM